MEIEKKKRNNKINKQLRNKKTELKLTDTVERYREKEKYRKQRERKTERQRDRETERQRDRRKVKRGREIERKKRKTEIVR